MSKTTSIKVSTSLRDRIAARAERRSVTQAVVIADALDALDRRELWRSISDGYERLAERPDEWQEYVEERDAWIEAPLTDTDR